MSEGQRNHEFESVGCVVPSVTRRGTEERGVKFWLVLHDSQEAKTCIYPTRNILSDEKQAS
jgi:hypothetical protein